MAQFKWSGCDWPPGPQYWFQIPPKKNLGNPETAHWPKGSAPGLQPKGSAPWTAWSLLPWKLAVSLAKLRQKIAKISHWNKSSPFAIFLGSLHNHIYIYIYISISIHLYIIIYYDIHTVPLNISNEACLWTWECTPIRKRWDLTVGTPPHPPSHREASTVQTQILEQTCSCQVLTSP